MKTTWQIEIRGQMLALTLPNIPVTEVSEINSLSELIKNLW